MGNQNISDELLIMGGKDAGVLKRFMKEFFPYSDFKKIGFFKPEMKNDYYAQAKRVCVFFGFTTVFEYGAKEIKAHISFADPECPIGIGTARPLLIDNTGELIPEPFVTVIPSIYE